jgi:hypothetical protein
MSLPILHSTASPTSIPCPLDTPNAPLFQHSVFLVLLVRLLGPKWTAGAGSPER